MNNNFLLVKAEEAYQESYRQSENQIVSRAMNQLSDPDDIVDYVESYCNILQDGWVLFSDFWDCYLQLLGTVEAKSVNTISKDILSSKFTIVSKTNDRLGTTHDFIRPRSMTIIDDAQMKDSEAAVLPRFPNELKDVVVKIVEDASRDMNQQWVPLVRLAPMFIRGGVDYKTLGYPKLRDMILQLGDVISSQQVSSTEILISAGAGRKVEETPVSHSNSKPIGKRETPDYQSKVVSAISNLNAKHNVIPGGWVDSIYVGPELKSVGVDYKKLGYKKLKEFLQSMPDIIQLDQVSRTELHVRLKQGISSVQTEQSTMPSEANESLTPYEKLIAFAWFSSAKDSTVNGIIAMIKELQTKTLDENWSIEYLQYYFYFTFDRLLYEDSRVTSDQEIKIRKGNGYAIFNTGLVDSCYYPLYALFKKNIKGRQEWVFNGFHTEFERIISSVKKKEGWKDLPKPARFYDSPDDLIFDVESQIDVINWEHIIIDNIDRIPYKFICTYRPEGFILEENPSNPREYFEHLREAVKQDQYTYRKLVELFDAAMKRAINHATWNFHYAIPMYYPRRKKVSMLLPLVLEDNREHHVDLAMVLERDAEHKGYSVNTIMTLKQVFCNVRLISQINESDNWYPQIQKNAS